MLVPNRGHTQRDSASQVQFSGCQTISPITKLRSISAMLPLRGITREVQNGHSSASVHTTSSSSAGLGFKKFKQMPRLNFNMVQTTNIIIKEYIQ
jgi:hypothetical protein